MKMKRSKIDVINATVESYLKRRRYQDCDLLRKPEKSRCCTSEEITMNATAERGTSRDNSILFSAIMNDVVASDLAYQRLKSWISNIANEKLKQELQSLLYPVFCHLYLEMLHTGSRAAAVQFMKTHQSDFTLEIERDFLDELSSVFSIQDIELRPLVNAFRTRKYKVDMSDEAHTCLQQFLTKHGHIIIMQIINIHVTIDRKIVETIATEEECDEVQRNELGINGHVEQVAGTGVDREMRELQEAIRLLRECPARPLRMFTVKNAIEHASAARIAPKMDKLVAGFCTSEIKIWPLGETVLMMPQVPSSCTDEPSTSQGFIEDNCPTVEGGAIVLRGHKKPVHDLRFIPEAEALLSVSSDNDMRAWRLTDYTCAAIYSGHNYPIWCMDTSPFNLWIATASHDRTAKLWTLERTYPLRIFAGHFLDVNSVRFHPNGRYVATGSSDKTIRLWNIDDGKMLRVLLGAQSTVFSLAFSPDGKYLAASGGDKKITIYDLATNSILTELEGHENTVMNLDWSDDGQYIASGSTRDGVVRMWSTTQHIMTGNSGSSYLTEDLISPQVYQTNFKSLLSLQYFQNIGRCPVAVGTG